MATLLTTQYRPVGAELLSGIASITQNGQRMQAEQNARAQSMAQQLIQNLQRQREFESKLDFDQQQEARMQRQLGIQEAHYRAVDDRERKRIALEEADRLPFTSPFGDSPGTPAAPNGSVAEGLGKLTSYGYASDPHGDSASLGTGKWAEKGPTGAWSNRLSPASLAISPDVEQAFKAAGIKEGDSVALQLANGQILNRTWDDRTMQDEQAVAKFGKPLRGRFDLFNPAGVHELDGAQVVGFRPAKSLDQPFASSIPTAANPNPDTAIRSMADRLARSGISTGAARKLMGEAILDQFAADAGLTRRGSTSINPLVRNFPDGTIRQFNRATDEWDTLAEKPEQDTSTKERQAEERLTLSKLKTEQSQLKAVEKKMEDLEQPQWPWEEDGKYFRAGFMGKKEITEDEFKSLKKEAESTEWAKLNHEAEKRRQKIAELEGSMRGAAPAAPAPAPQAPGAPITGDLPLVQNTQSKKYNPATGKIE